MPRASGCDSSAVAALALDGPRQLDARRHAEFAEDVAQVRLHGLQAEEQLRRDLGVRVAVDDELADLHLPRAERSQPVRPGRARPGAALDPFPEAAQLLLGGVPVGERAAFSERGGRALVLGHRAAWIAVRRE